MFLLLDTSCTRCSVPNYQILYLSSLPSLPLAEYNYSTTYGAVPTYMLKLRLQFSAFPQPVFPG